jgi:hypothetical protein
MRNPADERPDGVDRFLLDFVERGVERTGEFWEGRHGRAKALLPPSARKPSGTGRTVMPSPSDM